jgi:hypothetical protein
MGYISVLLFPALYALISLGWLWLAVKVVKRSWRG